MLQVQARTAFGILTNDNGSPGTSEPKQTWECLGRMIVEEIVAHNTPISTASSITTPFETGTAAQFFDVASGIVQITVPPLDVRVLSIHFATTT